MKYKHSHGFDLVKATVLTLIVAALVALVLPAFTRSQHSNTSRITCVSSQKQLGIAFRGFQIDLGATPMRLSETNAPATQPNP